MTKLPDVHTRAEVIAEALPFMQRYDQEVVVIKYGGHAMGNKAAAEDFAEDVVLLELQGVKPIVVSTERPWSTAQSDEPLPRWQLTSRSSFGRRFRNCAARRLT